MKYAKITALLGLAQLTLHSGIVGMGKPVAKLTEEDLEKIENALENNENIEALQQKLSDAEASSATFEKVVAETAQAVENAMETAGLEKQEGLVENINLLGEKCKEFGESKDRHSFADNNGKDDEGKEKYIDGHIDPNDAHNQLINQLS